MTALVGPFMIVSAILGLGGIAKLASPTQARRAVRAVGVEVPLPAIRMLGLGELALAVVAVLKGGMLLPIAVGMAYIAFAAFVVLLLRAESGTSCGCFGSASTPPSALHVAVNLASAGVAFSATGVNGLRSTLGDQVGAGLPLVAVVVVGSYALFLVLTALPAVLAPPERAVAPFTLYETEHTA